MGLTVILKLFLLLRWYFWRLSSPVTLEYQGAWMPSAGTGLEMPCSPPQSAHRPSNCLFCRHLPAQGICFGILPWPSGLSAARFALGTSAASQGPPSAASHKLRITAQWGPLCVRWCSNLLGTGSPWFAVLHVKLFKCYFCLSVVL